MNPTPAIVLQYINYRQLPLVIICNNSPLTNFTQNSSIQQHSQNSQSTAGAATPTLMANNSANQTNFQNQHQFHSPHISPLRQQIHSHQISPQFSQQFQQPTAHQASPSITHPQQYTPTTIQPPHSTTISPTIPH